MQKVTRVTRISALALGVVGALAVGNVAASGFQLKENSVRSMGRAHAGSAVSNGDASVVANNPAAMSGIDENLMQVGVTLIDLDADFTGSGTAAAGSPLASPLRGGNGGDPSDAAAVPSSSAIFPIHEASGLTIGAMISAPFGLKTEWEDGWVGRYNAITSEVTVVDLTLSAAVDITDRFSVGAGFIYERAEVKLSNDIDFGSGICALSISLCTTPSPATAAFGPQKNDGRVVVEGDDTGVGFVVGMQFRPTDSVTIGYSHRSEIDYNLTGDADFSGVPAIVASSGRFSDSAVSAPLTLPSIDTLSVMWRINDDFALMADAARTGWESLRNVTINFANPRQGATVEDFDWEDTMFYSLGGEWAMSDRFMFRAGVAFDETPTNDVTRTPRLPDADRKWLSAGVTWNASENLSIDAGYTHILVDDPTVNNARSSSGSTLTGSFDANANLFGVGARYRF
ncbi:MAG: outer membrane protein transport protein [Luteimonas sp.]